MTEPVQVEQATPEHRDQALRTLVAAFRSDPALRYFFPDEASYPALARAFMGALFDTRVAAGTVWVIDDAYALSMWEQPQPPSPARLDPGAAGAAHGELSTDPQAADRIRRYADAVHKLLPDQPYWYLGVLATHPDGAGRGWGRAVMAPGLRRAAQDNVPAVLETTNPANVGWYERAGWAVTGRTSVDELTVWVLAHPGLS